jgi:hypothetical protein
MDKRLFDLVRCMENTLWYNYNRMVVDRIPMEVVSIVMHLRSLNVLLQVSLVCEGDLEKSSFILVLKNYY